MSKRAAIVLQGTSITGEPVVRDITLPVLQLLGPGSHWQWDELKTQFRRGHMLWRLLESQPVSQRFQLSESSGPLVVEQMDAFEAAIGGEDQLTSVRAFLSREERLPHERARLLRELDKLQSARFEESASAFHMVLLPEQHDAADEEGYINAEGFEEYRQEVSSSYAWATTAEVLAVDAGELRASIAEEWGNSPTGPEDDFFEHYLLDVLEHHYEDAADNVVDWDALGDVVRQWSRREDHTVEERTRFDEDVAAWNAKQTVTTYNVDYGVVVPVRQGWDKQDIIAHHRARILSVEADIEAIGKTPFPSPSYSEIARTTASLAV